MFPIELIANVITFAYSCLLLRFIFKTILHIFTHVLSDNQFNYVHAIKSEKFEGKMFG